MPNVYNESRNYPAPKEVVLGQAVVTLGALGFKIKTNDQAKGLIEAVKGISVRSWGEIIKITVTSSNVGSQVYVESKGADPIQAVDWGKNKDNVQKILVDLDNRLVSSSSGLPPPPPPPPP
jgi:hypothetical protein